MPMKLTAKTDLEVPAAYLYAALTDHQGWERDAIRHGVEVERPAGTPQSGVGAEWRIRAQFRGKARTLLIRIDAMQPDQRLGFHIDSPSVEGTAQLEVVLLSPRRSRLRLDVEVRPKTLAARLFINTLRLAKGRVQAKFEKRLGQLGARIKERYDRSQG
jgi:Polyketide cyclase / dehydrase and lipid transport